MKEELKVSGILNIVLSGIYFLISIGLGIFPFICFLLLLISGIIFVEYSKLNNLNDKKDIILILSILCTPINLCSALINLLSIKKLDKVNGARAPNIDPEIKKIDILIKLGIGLISLSMIIFITTVWNSMSNITVITILSLFMLLFFILYHLFDKKLKLISSTKLYFALYNVFIILIYLAFGYFELFGNFFSLFGDGIHLYKVTIYLLSALIVYSFKRITKSNIRIYTIFTLILLSIYNLLSFINLDLVETLLIINGASIALRYLVKNKYLINYTNILMRLFIVITGFVIFNEYSFSLLLLVITNIVLLNYLNIHENNNIIQLITPLITFFYIGCILGNILDFYNQDIEYFILYYGFVLTIIYMIIMLIKILNKKTIFKRTFVITYNIIYLVLSIMSFYMDIEYTILILSLRSITVFSYFYYEYKYKIKDIEYYLLPINSIIMLVSLLVIIDSYISLTINVVLLILMLFISIYYIFIKNKVLYTICYILMLILNIINVFSILNSDSIILTSLTLVSTILPISLITIKDDMKYFKVTFVYSLISSYIVLLNNIFDMYISFILNMVLYLSILMITIKNNEYSKYIKLFISLPLITFISRLDINSDISTLFINYIILLASLVFIKYFINNNDTKKILFIIFSAIILLFVIFRSNNMFGIYVGILSLITLIYSSITKDNKSIFIYSLIVTIINVLFRLRNIWDNIDLWIYLLVAGLSIILIATIKEINKMKK